MDWTGEQASRQRTQQSFDANASGQVYSLPLYIGKRILADRFQDNVSGAERVWINAWHIVARMCQTKICIDRNSAVYRASSLGMNAETHQDFGFVHRPPTGYREERISKGRVCTFVCYAICMHRDAGERTNHVTSSNWRHPLSTPNPSLEVESSLRKYKRSCT